MHYLCRWMKNVREVGITLNENRVVLNNAGSVLERYDYYPFGEKIPVMVANTGNTDYLYNI